VSPRLRRARGWLRLPRRTIRLRLTVLFGLLFLLAGAALLGVTYLLVDHQYTAHGASLFIRTGKLRGEVFVQGSASGSGQAVSVSVQRAGVVGGKAGSAVPGPPAGVPSPGLVEAAAQATSNVALHQLLLNSALALTLMAVISIWLGWLVAGRALRPLRTITNSAKLISANNLHRRLALGGPDDELKQLGTTFDDLLGRLEASFEAQRQFVANASHELRTPLTLERALVEVALADPNPSIESLRDTCARVLVASEHQERLLEALLTLSRSQRGLETVEPVDLAALAREALEAVDQTGLIVTATLESAPTSGDRRLLERLVANLLTNAVRHNIPGGQLELRTATRAGRARLSLSNSGAPIPAAELERLVRPFQRLESERTTTGEGLGLGLSIVQAIVTAHGGRLTTRARPEGGLDVEVSLPSTPARRQAVSASTARGEGQRSDQAGVGSR
jgi:signal transduction histidine kinase